jgi:hypothetical protein
VGEVRGHDIDCDAAPDSNTCRTIARCLAGVKEWILRDQDLSLNDRCFGSKWYCKVNGFYGKGYGLLEGPANKESDPVLYIPRFGNQFRAVAGQDAEKVHGLHLLG